MPLYRSTRLTEHGIVTTWRRSRLQAVRSWLRTEGWRVAASIALLAGAVAAGMWWFHAP